jgi:DNA-binding NarL/FixJ family response regulator
MPGETSSGLADHNHKPRTSSNISPPRVYVVSDVRLHRDGLIAVLARQSELHVLGAGGSSDVIVQIQELRPQVLLLDLMATEGLTIPRRALQVLPALRVVAFAVSEMETNVFSYAEAGICAYVEQDGSLEDLVSAVLHALRDELVCSPRIAALLFDRVATQSRTPPAAAVSSSLTRREREIAALVATGLANKEIARRLHLGPATIKNHVHNILQKLNVRRRREIIHSISGTPPERADRKNRSVNPLRRLIGRPAGQLISGNNLVELVIYPRSGSESDRN